MVLAEHLERAQHQLLASDDVLRRQAAEPLRRRLDRNQRVGEVAGSRGQKSEHALSRRLQFMLFARRIASGRATFR